MKVIARPRGTGKTKELIETAAATEGLILTTNKRALKKKAEAYGYPNVEIIELGDLIYGNYTEDKPLYVHKLEDVMSEYFYSDFDLRLEGYSIALEE